MSYVYALFCEAVIVWPYVVSPYFFVASICVVLDRLTAREHCHSEVRLVCERAHTRRDSGSLTPIAQISLAQDCCLHSQDSLNCAILPHIPWGVQCMNLFRATSSIVRRNTVRNYGHTHSIRTYWTRVQVPQMLEIKLTDEENEICTLLDQCTRHLKETEGTETSCRIAGGWVRDKVSLNKPVVYMRRC